MRNKVDIIVKDYWDADGNCTWIYVDDDALKDGFRIEDCTEEDIINSSAFEFYRLALIKTCAVYNTENADDFNKCADNIIGCIKRFKDEKEMIKDFLRDYEHNFYHTPWRY